ncbi:unnamed protein product [Cylicocyclus nassatus]|uniref:Uncharacterized protein n=1 Tax=Cylicocyclus nassatus TaxID=53992 RepID=A0AA36MCA7_CYLNA|nr:unnamed protein product [Cylicocyclus nassatus]
MSSFDSSSVSSSFTSGFDIFPRFFSSFPGFPNFPCLTNWYPELGFPDWGRLAFVSIFGKAQVTDNIIVDDKTTSLRNTGGKENNATNPKGASYVLHTQKDTTNGTTVLIVKTINGTAVRLLSEPRYRSHWKQNLEPSGSESTAEAPGTQ